MSTPLTILTRSGSSNTIFQSRKIIQEIVFLNTSILFLIFTGFIQSQIALFGGLCIILYLTHISLSKPLRAFFIFFGIKLTFDGLWFIELPVRLPGNINLLVLIIIPLIILVFLGLKIPNKSVRWTLEFSFIYLSWVIIATLFNGNKPNINLLVRQSAIIFGFIIGLKYIKDKDSFGMLCKVVFISTIIPILASLVQFLAYKQGISFLFHKISSVRGVRLCGIYFDPATTGMVNLISMITNLYLVMYGDNKNRYRKFLLLFYALSLFSIAIGGTRSMVLTAAAITIIPLVRKPRLVVKFAPLILIVAFVSQPYVEKAVEKTIKETQKIKFNDFKNILNETEYSTAFTGRVNLWQDIWKKYKSSTDIQKLFGTGLTSNAHSSYFFLLLQIGLLGLMFYVLFHLKLLYSLWQKRSTNPLFVFGMLAVIAILMVGSSASTVMYTSFQWLIYLLIASSLNIVRKEAHENELELQHLSPNKGLELP